SASSVPAPPLPSRLPVHKKAQKSQKQNASSRAYLCLFVAYLCLFVAYFAATSSLTVSYFTELVPTMMSNQPGSTILFIFKSINESLSGVITNSTVLL